MWFSLTFLAVSWKILSHLHHLIFDLCLVSYNFGMIPHVCSPTSGLNMSGAWGGVFWRVMCWSKCLVLWLRYWNVPLEGWYYVSWPLSRRTFIVWTLLELYKCSIHCERDISRWLSACPPCSWWPRGEVATSSSSLSSLSYCWCPCPSSSRSARQATWRTNSTV